MEHNKGSSIGSFFSGMVVAAVVGGYLLFGSRNARKNRQKVEDWVEDARAEVVLRLKKVKRLSRDKYNEIVDAVTQKYSEMKEVGKEKADELRDELKGRWQEIEEEARREAEKEEK